MKTITFVARDFAYSACFERLAPILRSKGFNAVLFIGKGKPLCQYTEEIALKETVKSSDLVILGMSSSPELAKPEIAAGIVAEQEHIPFGFYGDMPGVWVQAKPGNWLAELAKNAAFYFGITEEDAKKAKEAFPNAKLIGTGNPLREEMAFPRFSRYEIRQKLGIKGDEKLILVPGGKFPANDIFLLTITIEALAKLAKKGFKFNLIFSKHPGDRLQYAIDQVTQEKLNVYEQMFSRSPVRANILGNDAIFNTCDIIPGADMVIECGSSASFAAIYNNIPVITIGSEIFLNYFNSLRGENILEIARRKISLPVAPNSSDLTKAIAKLLTPEGFAPLRLRQQKNCPKPIKGAALNKMADIITEMLNAE